MFSTATCGRLAPAAHFEVGGIVDESVRRQVWTLLAGLYPHHPTVERRGAQRFAYPQLLYLTTVDKDGLSPSNVSLVVVGRTLSETGLGFFHREPLADRYMIASLENFNREWVGFLIDLKWCRFNSLGWYESGGRFLQTIDSPIQNRGVASPKAI